MEDNVVRLVREPRIFPNISIVILETENQSTQQLQMSTGGFRFQSNHGWEDAEKMARDYANKVGIKILSQS